MVPSTYVWLNRLPIPPNTGRSTARRCPIRPTPEGRARRARRRGAARDRCRGHRRGHPRGAARGPRGRRRPELPRPRWPLAGRRPADHAPRGHLRGRGRPPSPVRPPDAGRGRGRGRTPDRGRRRTAAGDPGPRVITARRVLMAVPAPEPDAAPLSVVQEAIWYTSRLHPRRLTQRDDPDPQARPARRRGAEGGASRADRRHESLRTTFGWSAANRSRWSARCRSSTCRDRPLPPAPRGGRGHRTARVAEVARARYDLRKDALVRPSCSGSRGSTGCTSPSTTSPSTVSRLSAS